ncbi:MAG: hypothetical protein H6818_20805 [Phycisphaerales bacterium]|nr:hypothetical protein [Phycisphaerales bacterium]MCB9862231.1 hypothetical protein [Phycisphaerales bacterium]
MKYAAVVEHAREVTLQGTASAAPWVGPLERLGLSPFERDSRAEVLVSVAAGKWGIAFREVAVAVAACCKQGSEQPDGYYLAYAFHSSRLFGWCERTFFKAPHRHATIDVNDGVPASIEVRHGTQMVLHAAMGAERQASRREDVDLVMPLFLPARGSRDAGKRSCFHIRVAGETRVFPYLPESDFFSIENGGGNPAMPLLAECDFAGREWIIRSDTTHARTKTTTEKVTAN